MKFIKNILITFSTRIVAILLGAATGILTARVLGPDGRGAYSLIIMVPGLLAVMGNLGIGIANVYFGGSRKREWGDLASNSLVSALGLGTLLAAGFLGYFFIFNPSFLREIEPLHIIIATVVLPFNLFAIFHTSILLGQNRIVEYNYIGITQSAATLALVLFFLLALNAGVFGAVLGWTGASLVATTLVIFFVHRSTKTNWSFSPSLFKATVGFGVKGYLGNVIQFLNYRIDMFMVAYFMNVAFVGFYSIAVALGEILWLFPGAVGTVIFARTPGMTAEEANKSTPVICRNTFLITLITAFVVFLLSKFIIELLYGPEFLHAVQPLWILLPGIVALSICKVLSNEIAGRGKPIINTIAAGVSLAVNIPLNLVLIPRIGISGAALASTISYTVTAIIVLIVFLRISGNSLTDTIVIKPGDLKNYVKAFVHGYNIISRKGQ